MIKMYTENLPRDDKNKLIELKLVGEKVKFIYDDVEGEIEIVSYKNGYLYIRFLNTYLFRTTIDNFEKCLIEDLISHNRYAIGTVKLKSKFDFIYEIGQVFKDDKRDLTIIDRGRYNGERGYKIKCNKCGFDSGKHITAKNKEHKDEYWIGESSLKRGSGCACCSGRILAQGYNDVATTEPWMIPYFQGGIDEAKMYTRQSNKSIYPICPICGRVRNKLIAIRTICDRRLISCECSDKIPYPEKFMFNVLEQLNITFYTQINHTSFEWCGRYIYDFLIINGDKESIYIETHGLQHYEPTNKHYPRNLKQEQENDEIKRNLAVTNGTKEENYIVIDCRYSKLEWIKNSILHSNLANLFDLSIIDWEKVQTFALSSRVKEACELFNIGTGSPRQIAEVMKLNNNTVRSYLHKGAELRLCNYGLN